MPESLKDAIDTITNDVGTGTIHLTSDDATNQAIRVIGKQAAGIGVSFLVNKTHMQGVINNLGITLPSATIDDLVKSAEKLAIDSAYKSLETQGTDVIDAAKSQWGNDLPQAIKDKLHGSSFETDVVNLINNIRKIPNLDRVDVKPLKEQLLNCRDAMINSIGEKTQKPREAIEAALDKLNKQTTPDQVKSLRIPLPDAVISALGKFNTEVQSARAKVSLFVSPDGIDRMASQLATAGDENQFNTKLVDVRKQLEQNVQSAVTSVTTARQSLDELKNSLDKVKIDARQAQYHAQAAMLEASAGTFLTQEKQHLIDAACEAVLISKQQKQIETLETTRLDKLVDQQTAVIQQREAELAARRSDVVVARYLLDRANAKVEEWSFFNSEENPNEKLSRRAARRVFLDSAAATLNQQFQLINTYEFDVSRVFPTTLNGQAVNQNDYIPTYLIENYERLVYRQTLYSQATDLQKVLHPSDYELLSSLHYGDLRIQNDGLRQALIRFLPPAGGGNQPSDFSILRPYLELNGRRDLDRLRNGFYFRVDRIQGIQSWDRAQRVSVQDSLQASGKFPILPWDDIPVKSQLNPISIPSITRIRLLGVQLDIKSGQLPNVEPALTFNQLSDGWISYRNADNQIGAIGLDLPQMVDKAGEPDILLRSGAFTFEQIETRPLFATYVLRIDQENYSKLNPDLFHAVLHFVAIGIRR